jgi:TPR repeat protein
MHCGLQLLPHGTKARRAVAIAISLLAIICLAGWLILPAADVRTDLARGRYSAAFEKLQPMAASGDPWSQNQLGNLYYLGLGTKVDLNKAAEWYLRAGFSGWADAQINIGYFYWHGRGVKADFIRADGWLRHARSSGKEIAETRMAWLVGMLTMTPSQLQLSKQLYQKLEDLRPEGFE